MEHKSIQPKDFLSINVLMISTGRGAPPENPKGGVENEAYLLANSLAKHVRSVHYVENLGKVNLPKNVFIHNVVPLQNLSPTFFTELASAPIIAYRVANAARRAFAEDLFDIIHFHETRGNLPVHLLSGIGNLPIVISIHGPVPWTVKYDSRIETFVRVQAYRIFDISAFKKANHLIAISSWIRKNLIKLGIPGKKVSVVYNPIDTTVFSPKRKLEKRSKAILNKLKLEPSSYYFTVGSLVARKRHIDLVRAFASYKGDKKLVIVGDGAEFSKVRRWISKHSLNNRIKMIRQVDAGLLPYLYANAHAFVTCSMAEGLPVAVMEAMSSGLGIISPDAPWIEELVGESNGVLFQYSRKEATTDAFNLFDRVCSKRFGLTSRKIAESLFGIRACVAETLRIYESVVN